MIWCTHGNFNHLDLRNVDVKKLCRGYVHPFNFLAIAQNISSLTSRVFSTPTKTCKPLKMRET